MNGSPAILKLDSVSRTFGRGHASIRAVDGVSLGVSAGEIVLIMGPSGSGKTTLLSMAGGLLAADEGEVVVAGSSLASLGPAGLARALANEPALILADEPTGNLDSRSGRDVMMLLFDLAREEGKAVVVVSHDARIIDIADRVLWLEDGRLSARPREVEESVTDPVCGMRLQVKDVAFSTNYRRRVFHFCSEDCRSKFLGEPERYT